MLHKTVIIHQCTMMSRQQFCNQFLLLIVLVCCWQQGWAGVVLKGGKSKNSTTKATHKAKATTTTAKTDIETTTLPVDRDIQRHNSFFNNKDSADADKAVTETSPPLYELLQQQMESVLSNTAENIQSYANDSPQMKEAVDGGMETQKLPGKPLFPYGMRQFDDYDEEDDTSEYDAGSEYIPENCEDAQENSGVNNCANGYSGATQLTNSNFPVQNNYGPGSLDNSGPDIFENSTPNLPYDSSNYGNNNQNMPNESSNYGSQANTNQAGNYGTNTPQNGYISTKPMQQQQSHNNYNNNNSKYGNKLVLKHKPSSQYNSHYSYGHTKPNENYQQSQPVQVIQYVQSRPLEHYGTHPNSYDKSKSQQQNQKQYYNTGKHPHNSYSNQKQTGNIKHYAKPLSQQIMPGFNNKPLYGTTATSFNHLLYNNSQLLTSSYDELNQPVTTTYYTNGNTYSLNPYATTNFPSYENVNTENSSPFSINYGHGKFPHNGPKRHLSFRTVSSSTQYVATPLADLMFNFSIGMAKPFLNAKLRHHNSLNNQAQVFNVINE